MEPKETPLVREAEVSYIDANGLRAMWLLITGHDECGTFTRCLCNVDEKAYRRLDANLSKVDLVALKELVCMVLDKLEHD